MRYLTAINTFPDLFHRKIYFLVCNSTLPPLDCYRFGNQWFVCGGIMGGIWVELHEVPPIFHP